MFGAILRFLATWVPFLKRLFPEDGERADPKDGIPEVKELPPARVAIVGAGLGGCLSAHFLRELGGQNLDLHVWEKNSSEVVGGRTAVMEFQGHLYETGGSVIHTSNEHLVDLAKKFELDTKGSKDEATTPLGLYTGKRFSFRTGYSNFITIIKSLWRYGLSLIRMDYYVRAVLKKFVNIYDLQRNHQSFATVQEMLKAMGGQEFIDLTQTKAEDFLIGKLGWSEKLVKELVVAALRMNYGQNGNVDAFTTLVALAGMEENSLWSVVGGNKLIAKKSLEASGASMHWEEVDSIARVESDGKVSYSVQCGQSSLQFDVVIIANPLNISTMKFLNFPTPVYSKAATTPFQRTVAEFVKGEINPAFFGLETCGRDFPQTILTTEMEGSPFEYRSVGILIPSEIPAKDVKQFQKPLNEDPVRVWKVFAPQPLTEEEKQQMFMKIEDQATVD